MYGQAIGDMLGEPVEGMSREEIAVQWRTVTDFISPPSITDDTMMTHLVARSVCEVGVVDRRRIAAEFLKNRARIPRMGPTTARALSELASDPNFIPTTGTTNGAAMRAPAIAWLCPTEAVVRNTIESSLATHGDPVAIAGACAIACAVSHAINGANVRMTIRAGVCGASKVSVALASRITESVALASRVSLEDAIKTIGCGIETIEAVPAVFAIIAKYPDFKDGVLTAVNLGGDTDTIAGMVGAITGGMPDATIPSGWITACADSVGAMIEESWGCVQRLRDVTV